jgi:hypothetical protein
VSGQRLPGKAIVAMILASSVGDEPVNSNMEEAEHLSDS